MSFIIPYPQPGETARKITTGSTKGYPANDLVNACDHRNNRHGFHHFGLRFDSRILPPAASFRFA
jgi:hypothetical protein